MTTTTGRNIVTARVISFRQWRKGFDNPLLSPLLRHARIARLRELDLLKSWRVIATSLSPSATPTFRTMNWTKAIGDFRRKVIKR